MPRVISTLLLVLAVTIGEAQLHAGNDVDYARDVAPIFRSYCVGCHNDTDREGELSLETYASLRRGGEDRGDPIQPGDPDASFLVRSVEGAKRPKMPPRGEPSPPASAIALLRRWVESGAPGPLEDRSILRSLTTPALAPSRGAAPITALALSPDASLLAVGRYARVELLDPVSYALRREIGGLPGKVNSISFSSDGDALVIATGVTGLSGEARRLALDGDAEEIIFGGHDDVLHDAVISPDGTLLATAGYDRRIRLWRFATGELLREIDVHKGAIFDLAFDTTGTVLASASADETVKLWRVSDGLRLDTLNQPQGEQSAVAFTAESEHVLSVGADRRVHLWRFVSRLEPALNPVVLSRFAHESPIIALELLRSGTRAVTAAADGSLSLWTLPDLDKIAQYEPQPDVVTAIVEDPARERFLVARFDGSIESYAIAESIASPATGSPSEPDRPVPGGSLAGAEPMPSVPCLETEPNDDPDSSHRLELPARVAGAIARPGDRDLYRFTARAGEPLTLEVHAARDGSKLDSRLEVLDLDGEPVVQVLLQATRDSWFTFRGKDSDTSDDFRVHNWREMELDEYLYANGEVVRLWLYPRGPDSGFKVYPGSGKRHTSFFTSALSHPLGEPCYVVRPVPPGSEPVPNGLPVFPVLYENDDDSTRRHGSDSVLVFEAPRDGEYLARVSDVRGFGGEETFGYHLEIRPARPDFEVSIGGKGPKLSPGSGRELSVEVTRLEGFDGPVRVDIEGLPEGFSATTPIVVEAGQIRALGAIHAAEDAVTPGPDASRAVVLRARAMVRGREIVRELGDLGELRIDAPAKLRVTVLPATEATRREENGKLLFEIRPGETISARVHVERVGFDARIELGGDDAGRNLPHGVFVDNIGLNGLLIVEGESEREFVITASPIARAGDRLFHLRATGDGGQCSAPAILRVLAPASATE